MKKAAPIILTNLLTAFVFFFIGYWDKLPVNAFFVISHVLNALLLFSIGHILGQRTEKGEIFKYVIGAAVVGVWIFHVVISALNANIEVNNWEHIITGLVVYSLWKGNGKNSFVDLLILKLTGIGNAKEKVEV